MDTQQRIDELADRLSPAGADLVRRAYVFARTAHRGQRRRHGPPYIEHPVAVAWLAHEEFGVRDGEVLAAALLHDVLEDTDATDLDAFPARTARLVRLLTDPYPPDGRGDRRDRFAQLWTDRDATLLKACDRLANLNDSLLQYDPAFCARYAWRTRRELLVPGLPLADDPVAHPLLEAALRRCEERAAGPV
ncbi:MAG TPA: HD domain-containing protein [Terriglobales bacterium]|nr:HD domain-containing protein [Terriglobales bacterium]